MLADLPIEVLLDNVLPYLPVLSLVRLGQCSKLFATLCNDDTLWKLRLYEDYNFSGQGTARTSGWKFIYRGLFKPRVFVWGERANGRLGIESLPRSFSGGIPYPIEVKLPGIRVVSLVAGGMSFHALDSHGNVHVWGTLNGTMYAASNSGFSNEGTRANTPLRLAMPAPIRSISCGRLHSSFLDSTNKIWTLTNWGRPFWLSSQILSDPDYAPKQIECGWAFSSLLTKSGDVFVWWPFSGAMGTLVAEKMNDMDKEGGKKAAAVYGTIPCVPWDIDMVPTRLPSIPVLPEIQNTGIEEKSEDIRLIQIAAFDNHIVGLTNYGHVLKFGALHDETGVPHGRWEYLPQFSEIDRIKEQPAFSGTDDGVTKVIAPQTMQITHISANFLHFVAYSTGSSSIVLVGETNTTPVTAPQVIPEIQNKSVISVVIGDYHSAALTADGKLFTWGKYSKGALGLGDPAKLDVGVPGGFASERDLAHFRESRRAEPPAVSVPTEVRFDHNCAKPRDRFCFATTAAGWHTGALPGDDEEEEEEIERLKEEDPPVRRGGPFRNQWETPPIIPNPIFRLGHAAGRGQYRIPRDPQPPAGGSSQ
ncbi:hypothetical protein NLJ89_g4452 [Agrocybe chaxingu]|uniref:F-box domain-containing protein n=1 Tax=Agrocybe chaxingu TaxID=84603 RepID=A0A9W8K0I3_9AGAR|nr:hypothetical protein NLJ89_g4452 [Agrocybe chaxingu]